LTGKGKNFGYLDHLIFSQVFTIHYIDSYDVKLFKLFVSYMLCWYLLITWPNYSLCEPLA